MIPVIVGPTAVGKTTTAIEVAEEINGEIISADSRQVYQGMEIGSGAPSAEERHRITHHLVGCIDPEVRLSAGEFSRMARSVANEIVARGRIPIVVGGSGLYIRAMIDGLASIPVSDPVVRRDIEERIDEYGMERMIEELRRVDTEYAEKVGLHDRKRLIRALEVWETTGKSFSDWHRDQAGSRWCKPLFFGLNRPRSELHELISARVSGMLDAGWIDEVRALLDKHSSAVTAKRLSPLRLTVDRRGVTSQTQERRLQSFVSTQERRLQSFVSTADNRTADISARDLPPSMTETLGYKDVIEYLRDAIEIDSVKERIVISTRQFAKRQLTWFRADDRVKWRECSGSDAHIQWAEWILKEIKKQLGSRQTVTESRL